MPNIRHEVVIGASARAVFEALTTSEGLSGWWTGNVTAKAERDSVARFPFGPEYFKEMRISRLQPPTLVEWTCVAGVDEWVGTKLSFDIASGDHHSLLGSYPEAQDQIEQQSGRGEQTILSFSHDGWRQESAMFAECNYTWGQFLRSLKLLCETGKGRPWPNQHRTSG